MWSCSREVGAFFSVNNMLCGAECYKRCMEKGLSFLEFNHDHAVLRFLPPCSSTTDATCSSAVMTSGPTCWRHRAHPPQALGKDATP